MRRTIKIGKVRVVNAAPPGRTIFKRSVTYFQFQFPYWSAFVSWPTERERVTSDYRFEICVK